MGRIKTLPVKNIARKLVKDEEGAFTSDFKENKEVLGRLVKTSKKMKNAIAGYVTRLVKIKKK